MFYFWIKNVMIVLFFMRHIIIENIIINPPIFKTVVIEFSMEFLSAMPILGAELAFVLRELVFFRVLFFFVIIPMNIHER